MYPHAIRAAVLCIMWRRAAVDRDIDIALCVCAPGIKSPIDASVSSHDSVKPM